MSRPVGKTTGRSDEMSEMLPDIGASISINPVAGGSNRQRNRWLRKKRKTSIFKQELEQQHEAQHDKQTDPGHVDFTA
jgi:hypothetical protein